MTDNNELAEALAEIAVLRRRWSDSESKLAACDSDLRTILAERDGLRADAARYRWLRGLDGACDSAACVNFNIGFDWIEQHGDELDAAIDAAMAAEGRTVGNNE